ncbi:MAG: hypothetical protein IPJ47_17935 [Anaerolineales bacterium]|nr:hypothetical protein [Anaerolineales bacterium]
MSGRFHTRFHFNSHQPLSVSIASGQYGIAAGFWHGYSIGRAGHVRCFPYSRRYGELFALTATMALFALGLAGLWASGNTQSVVLNGLIPLTDAVGYYTDATRLQYGVDVSNFTAMRPFFAGLLSFFLRLTGRNLMVTVGIFTAIAGFASYLASREIQKTHGTELAVFFLILTFLYYRHHSGTTMSESLGVSVSLLGIALIWKGIADQKEWLTLFGVGVIALALNIRPGAMFVLPALLLWGGWIFRGQGKFSYKFFLWGPRSFFSFLRQQQNDRLCRWSKRRCV